MGNSPGKESNGLNDVINYANNTLTARKQRGDEEQRVAEESREAIFEEATHCLNIEAFPFDENNGRNVDIQVDSLDKIGLVSSLNATETTTSRITPSKSTTTSNKSPYVVPISKRSLDNTIMKTRERAIRKKQKLKHGNAESSKNVGMRKSNRLVMESKEQKTKHANTDSSKNVRTVHGKQNSKQYHKRKGAKIIKTGRKPSKGKSNGNPINYICEKCGLHFNSNQCLRSHLQKVNANQNSFRCDQCHFSTNYVRSIRDHVDSIHMGVFNYRCELCEYGTNRRFDLKVHIKSIHLEPNAHKCNECEYHTGRIDNLVLHKQAVHKGVKYQCSLCDFSTSYKYDLKKHRIQKHNEGDLIKCELCSYTSRSIFLLKRHKNNVHP